jgi:hypothetical protein
MNIDLFGLARIAALVTFVLFSSSLLLLLYLEWNNAALRRLVVERFPAIIGLPASGVFAFLLVAIFESTSGTVKFEALTIKFEGAAGPIIMWIFSLVAITLCIRTLWVLKTS